MAWDMVDSVYKHVIETEYKRVSNSSVTHSKRNLVLMSEVNGHTTIIMNTLHG